MNESSRKIEVEKGINKLNALNQLTDLQICQMLADIKGLLTYSQFDSIRVNVPEGDDYYFNPLEDKALCADLMDEFDVERVYEPYDCIGFHYHVINDKCSIVIAEIDTTRDCVEFTMQKAICLAIIKYKLFSD